VAKANLVYLIDQGIEG